MTSDEGRLTTEEREAIRQEATAGYSHHHLRALVARVTAGDQEDA